MTTSNNLPTENKRNAKQLVEMQWLLRRNPNAVYHNYRDELHYFTYDKEVRGVLKPMMTWFWGNSKKVAGNYYYPNVDARTEKIERLKESTDSSIRYKEERKAKRSGSVDVKVGQILVDSWGYEQTNVDFYQVVKLVGKSTVVVRPISGETVGEPTSWCSDNVRPIKDSFLTNSQGEMIEERKRVSKWGNGENNWSIKTSSFSSARPCNETDTHHRSWGY